MQDRSSRMQHNLVPGTQTASIWIDESGTANTASNCFVIGAIKTRHADDLQRSIQAVRESHGHYKDELKFGRIKETNYRIYQDVVEVLEASDARLAVTVVDGSVFNPFRPGEPQWLTHAEIISKLVVGTVNRNEVVSVLMDVVSTPPGKSMGTAVKRKVNSHLRSSAVVTAVSLNSKSSDLLQAADLVAGAVFHQRTKTRTGAVSKEKAKIASNLAIGFGVDSFLSDARAGRLTVVTLKGERTRRK